MRKGGLVRSCGRIDMPSRPIGVRGPRPERRRGGITEVEQIFIRTGPRAFVFAREPTVTLTSRRRGVKRGERLGCAEDPQRAGRVSRLALPRLSLSTRSPRTGRIAPLHSAGPAPPAARLCWGAGAWNWRCEERVEPSCAGVKTFSRLDLLGRAVHGEHRPGCILCAPQPLSTSAPQHLSPSHSPR